MQFNKHVFFSALTVILLAALVCFRFFGEVILHPDEFLFGASGDGLKNYFSVAYQVIHGEGTWFNGMLYPYGDHLIFADGQPLLTKVLSWFIEPEVNNGTQIIAIMNLLMLGSLVVTAWCVHRLLVWNSVSPWFAVPFSLTIAFLSPQLARFIGHYALGYTFFVPMSWIVIAGFSRTGKIWLWSIITIIFVLVSAFIHPYYLFIFTVFFGAIIGWELVLKKFRFQQVENFLVRVTALIIPLVVFMAYQKWVDPYTDRPTAPSGIFSYMATFQSVFVPVAEPFRGLFNSYFFRIFIPGSWEGNAYVGMVATFTAFASVLAMGKRMASRKWKVLTHPILPTTLKTAFIPAIITLLFAMGLFHNLGLYWLSDFITPLKQFRSLGRIAWIFYYVFSVWTVYHLYVLFRHFGSIRSGKYRYHISLIVGLCTFLWMLDTIVNIKFNKEQMMNRVAQEAFSDSYDNSWKTAGVQIDDHQAIVPLPFMLIGSEKIGLESGHKSLLHAMKGSFSTGLPVLGGTMSRTSLEVTEKSAQFVADPLFPRKIFDDMKQDKNLLFIRSDEPLTTTEQLLISGSDPVYQCLDYTLYSASIADLKKIISASSQPPDSISFSDTYSYLKPADFSPNEEKLWGAETYRMNAIDDILDTLFPNTETLNLSYWVKLDPNAELLPNRVYTIDREWKIGGGLGTNPNVLDGWLFVSEELNTEAGKKHWYTIHARGGLISRIQLRPVGSNIHHREGELIFINNKPVL